MITITINGVEVNLPAFTIVGGYPVEDGGCYEYLGSFEIDAR